MPGYYDKEMALAEAQRKEEVLRLLVLKKDREKSRKKSSKKTKPQSESEESVE